jgi:Lanthionine synthetase C-like protein
MLYKPEAFEPLTETPWNESRVRKTIAELVDGVELPSDELDLFGGVAGAVFALDVLRRRGLAEPRNDLAGAAHRALDTPTHEPGLLSGETGILLVAWRLAPDATLADRLLARIHENVSHDANELMWGAPGTMVAARVMHDWTGETRWMEAWSESAAELRRRRDADGLWTQQLGGATTRYLGPVHGATGNVLALLQGDPAEDIRTTAETVERAAVREDGLANWPAIAGGDLEIRGQIRVQWCHGAPGIVASASSYLPEELLLAGAELTWRAGPHGEKGPGICHGTAGNGYAFLKVFERTGDERWLDRARRFAVHALEQVERGSEPRPGLWIGDLGVALYAADCLEARTRYPVIEAWD